MHNTKLLADAIREANVLVEAVVLALNANANDFLIRIKLEKQEFQ
ncbi:MAG: hypothetical protein WAN47_02565 [Nitrosotalea sp.]